MARLNQTHDPNLRSWVATANRIGCDFPIQNLPFTVFRRQGSEETFRGGIAIGDQILDLAALNQTALIDGDAAYALQLCAQDNLNEFMALGARFWSALRHAVFTLLREGASQRPQLEPCLLPQAQAEYRVPARIGDYTDFYTSIHHATRVGELFRPDNPLLPNYHWLPVGYHGRSSSIVISGQEVPRPWGQTRAADAATPSFDPCQRLDYELELGLYIGCGNPLGQPVTLDTCDDQLFGLCLLNDWSARDIQAWEYQPLGPFLGKNFATTLSPWIVTLEALEPFRTAWRRDDSGPQPLPYLESSHNRRQGALDIHLEAWLQTAAMRQDSVPPRRLSRANFCHAYWTLAQLVAHHTVNGCNLQPGDLLGSGTQSDPDAADAGCLLELSNGGRRKIPLPNGESRTFLEDGDRVILRGYCAREGAARIGFGEASGTVRAAAGTG